MNNAYESVIKNIKKVAQEKGIKQYVIAKRVGFSAQKFSYVLNNHRKLLRAEHLKPIADALEVDINVLFRLPDRKINDAGKNSKNRGEKIE